MQKVFLITVLAILSANFCKAQEKVIKWANDSLVIRDYDSIIAQTGDKDEGMLKLMQSRSKIIYAIKNGSIQSRYTYSLQGVKTQEMHFKHGQPHGKYTEWNNYSGKLIAEGYYKNGLKDSNWVFYHYNGEKQLEGRLLADSSNLIDYFEYERSVLNEEGEIVIERVMNNGYSPFDGDWIVYDEKGKKIQTLRFKKGVLVGFFFPQP